MNLKFKLNKHAKLQLYVYVRITEGLFIANYRLPRPALPNLKSRPTSYVYKLEQ